MSNTIRDIYSRRHVNIRKAVPEHVPFYVLLLGDQTECYGPAARAAYAALAKLGNHGVSLRYHTFDGVELLSVAQSQTYKLVQALSRAGQVATVTPGATVGLANFELMMVSGGGSGTVEDLVGGDDDLGVSDLVDVEVGDLV